MNKQPDLMDDQAIDVILFYLKHEEMELKKFTLKWIKECCVMHEMNR